MCNNILSAVPTAASCVLCIASTIVTKCHPICKSRRREWKSQILKTSAELLLERKPLPSCFRRYPKKVYPNSPCPLFGKTRRITVKQRGVSKPTEVVRICQAPIDATVDISYLVYAAMAQRLGALEAVRARCAFCKCCGGACCACAERAYKPRDAERALCRRADMRHFDTRVKHTYQLMRCMYNME